MEQQHGLLVVDKPRGLSSAQCTNRFKRLGQKKIGHAGTLDPMAQGVLLVLLGHATKISGYLMAGGVKAYQGTVRLGQTTDTWDADGQITAEAPWDHVTAEAVADVIAGWVGTSEQPVPPYSAAKHQGQPSTSCPGRERNPLKIKTIEISRAEVLRLSFRTLLSSHLQFRHLHTVPRPQLGTRLGCGAVLTELIREYSHPFGLDRACPLDTLLAEPETLPERVIPVTAALPHWPTITVTGQEEADTKNGKILVWTEARRARSRAQDGTDIPCVPGSNAVLLSPDGQPLALAEAVSGGPAWKVLRGLWN
ncbi:MAG: tRNA pseudouridine synthase B [Bilophila wadsworthia]